ncbi:major facilitator superfamily domain-containing protein [Pyrenochaeta sp. MPI-SDFR-AT-0127]|nr:major facilitator superfamily domain-containing protein [Pyrenochaeta sp. MPI-SDFR-AT-0127]
MAHSNPVNPLTIPDSQLEIELETSSRWIEGAEIESLLPSADGGKDAWLFLAAGFVSEIMVWGFPWSYGIFQDYYSTSLPFAGSSGIPAIGTSAMGILYIAAPVTFGTLIKFPHWKRPAIVLGLLTMCISLGLSSLCTTVPQLIATQGILYGMGGAITYSPVIQFMDEWFVRRKGFAFGVMWAGTGLGGVITPLLLEYLLHKFGFRTALRIWTVLLFTISLPLIWFLKPRLPVPATNRARLGFTFLKDKSFWILQLGNVLEGFGFFIPSIYLPTYANQLGFSSTVSALTIVLINIAAVFGSVAMGSFIDKWHVTTGILISTVGSVLSVFFIWGFSTSLPPLLIFCFLYGLSAGSFATTYPGILRVVQRNTGQMEGPMIFSFLAMGRGVGNVIAGPLSEALLKLGHVGEHGLYGTQYGGLVLFTGLSAAFGGVGILGKRAGWM